MIDREYKSILEITGVRLPRAVEYLKTKHDDIIVEEQFQVAYIMYYIEHKNYALIAKTLALSVWKVKKILTSYICNMMRLYDWHPMNLCINRDVAQEDNGYVFEYADLAEIEAKLDNYDKIYGKDMESDD